MSILVVDASVAIKWYIPEIYSEYSFKLQHIDYQLHVPQLALLEITNIICKKLRRNEITLDIANAILQDIQSVPLEWHDNTHLIQRAFEIANQTFRSFYDCLYLSLAILLDGKVVTADLKFYQGVQQTIYKNNMLWIENI